MPQSKSSFKFEDVTYQIILGRCIGPIWDDPDTAERLAASIGSVAKHAKNKFEQDFEAWQMMSVVSLDKVNLTQ